MIRADILMGGYRPGSMMSAPAVAKRLGVSVTPVREALLDLRADGLVDPVRNRGFQILRLDAHKLAEIREVRMLLEPPAMHRVVEHVTVSDLAALEQLAVVAEREARERDVAGFLIADRRFQLNLFAVAGNARLLGLIRRLRDQTMVGGVRELVEYDELFPTVHDHRPLLEALRARDGLDAEAIVVRQLHRTCWRLPRS